VRALRDYRCDRCEAITEEFGLVTDTHRCVCGGSARYKISAPLFKLEGVTGDFPTAADKWAKDHEKAAKIRQ